VQSRDPGAKFTRNFFRRENFYEELATRPKFTRNFHVCRKNLFEPLLDPDNLRDGSDMRFLRGRTVKKLALTAATVVAISSLGFAPSNQAKAQDRQAYPPMYGPSAQVLGEGGAHYANQCWVETWGGGSSYFGYWKPCTTPRTAKR
jgi:hypothetical protein